MARHVCPFWLGYVLASPVRRLWQDPARILAPFVTPGMTVLEPGCAMGFFTIPLARLVGPAGRVVALDMQPRMLAGLQRRAHRAGVVERIDTRVVQRDGLGIDDLEGRVDFALAFAMLHELPKKHPFFLEVHRALRPGGTVLAAEPRGHVTADAFEATMRRATEAGFIVRPGPSIAASHTAVLERRQVA